MNSLVSLKGLGEMCWFRKRYYVNPAPKEIFIKQRRKDNREIDVNPSVTMTQYLGMQAVSPIQAIGSNLNKSIPMAVGVEVSHSSKGADKNVGDLRKRKEKTLKCRSHCSDRSEKRDNSPLELYYSDENSPLSHRSRRSICEGGSGVGGAEKIVADVEEFSDDNGNIGGTSGEGSEKSCSEPDRASGPDVGQPRERGKGSSLMYPLGCSKRGQVDRPLPEYTAPQLCPPNCLMVAGFHVKPEYKDLHTRVITSKWHMASDMIQQMSELSGRDVTSTDLQRWRASVDTASAMDFHVSWLDDQLHLLESQIRDVEEEKVLRPILEAEVRDCEKRMSILGSKVDKARRAYKAAKVDKAKLTANVASLKARLASFEGNNQALIALSCSALGLCLGTLCFCLFVMFHLRNERFCWIIYFWILLKFAESVGVSRFC
ncbi:hypothetical protein MKX01_033134 [Papaver californicum]|nr:hypothetical protein MKX01_033134 [Papaver californicum]